MPASKHNHQGQQKCANESNRKLSSSSDTTMMTTASTAVGTTMSDNEKSVVEGMMVEANPGLVSTLTVTKMEADPNESSPSKGTRNSIENAANAAATAAIWEALRSSSASTSPSLSSSQTAGAGAGAAVPEWPAPDRVGLRTTTMKGQGKTAKGKGERGTGKGKHEMKGGGKGRVEAARLRAKEDVAAILGMTACMETRWDDLSPVSVEAKPSPNPMHVRAETTEVGLGRLITKGKAAAKGATSKGQGKTKGKGKGQGLRLEAAPMTTKEEVTSTLAMTASVIPRQECEEKPGAKVFASAPPSEAAAPAAAALPEWPAPDRVGLGSKVATAKGSGSNINDKPAGKGVGKGKAQRVEEARLEAKEAVAAILALRATTEPLGDSASITVVAVPPKTTSLCIGRRGSTIMLIERKTRTRISASSVARGTFEIRGSPAGRCAAAEALQAMSKRGWCSLQFEDYKEARLEGPSSRVTPDVLRKLQESFAIRVEIEKKGPWSQVLMGGQRTDVEKAREHLQKSITGDAPRTSPMAIRMAVGAAGA